MKRALYLLISLVYFGARRFISGLRTALAMQSPGQGVVLCYHAMPKAEVPRFTRQMNMLLRAGKAVRAGIVDSVPAGHRRIAVTFDDGYQSTLTLALPILRERNIPCTVFVISDCFGEVAPWAGTRNYRADDPFMTATQTAALPDGLVAVGSHTCSHPYLPSCEGRESKRELGHSKSALEKLTRKPTNLFAFPYGAHNAELLRECLAAGYTRVFTVEPRNAFQTPNEFVCGRVVVDPGDWDLEFWLKLRGGYFWRSPALRLKERFRLSRDRHARITTEHAVCRHFQVQARQIHIGRQEEG